LIWYRNRFRRCFRYNNDLDGKRKSPRKAAAILSAAGNAKGPNPSRLRLRNAGLLAAAIGFAALVYSNSFHAPFILDNDEIILRDPRVHTASALQFHRILTGQYWPTANTGLYRPLDTLTFLLDYTLLGHGADPYGYHWLNFLLHAANMVLVYLLGRALFERTRPALLLSLLWGLHPVLTESVTNIVGRADLLAAFGVLAALLCHRKAAESAGARKAVWLAAIAVATAIGIFSKESAIVTVAVFAIFDFTFARTSWRSRLPGYCAAAIPCLLYLWVRFQVLANASYQATPFYENPLLGAGFWTARFTAIKVIGEYVTLLVWPARLSWGYSYNAIPLSWNPGSLAALVACLAAAIAALRFGHARKLLFFAAAFFVVTLLPTSNLVILIGTIMAERFLYLPSVAFAIAVVWAAEQGFQRLPAFRNAVFAGLLVLAIGYAVRTYARNGDWLDQRRFWLSGVDAAPDSYKTNMAAATSSPLNSGEAVVQAQRYAERALAILDGLPDSRNSSAAYRDGGVFYRNLGDRAASKPEALSWYGKSLAALLRSEKIELVWNQRYQAENAERGKPGLTSLPGRLYFELGLAYLRLADTPHALASLERGRTLESSPELLEQLATLYREAGDARKAAAALVEALAVDPQRVNLISQLVELYGQIDPNGCAVSHEGGGVSLNQDCPLVHADICSASRNVIGNYLRRGQPFEADSIRAIAVKDLGCAADALK